MRLEVPHLPGTITNVVVSIMVVIVMITDTIEIFWLLYQGDLECTAVGTMTGVIMTCKKLELRLP